MFAGYGRYRRAVAPWRFVQRPPRTGGVFRGVAGLALDGWRDGLGAAEGGAAAGRGRVSAMQALDCAEWLPNDLLVKLDRCLMAHGVEGRTPFVDPLVAAFAFAPARSQQGRLAARQAGAAALARRAAAAGRAVRAQTRLQAADRALDGGARRARSRGWSRRHPALPPSPTPRRSAAYSRAARRRRDGACCSTRCGTRITCWAWTRWAVWKRCWRRRRGADDGRRRGKATRRGQAAVACWSPGGDRRAGAGRLVDFGRAARRRGGAGLRDAGPEQLRPDHVDAIAAARIGSSHGSSSRLPRSARQPGSIPPA